MPPGDVLGDWPGHHRADKRNAFCGSHMITQLSQALTRYENDDTLRCALIFAHGEHFTAGLDLMELQDKLDQGIFAFDSSSELTHRALIVANRTKPVIAGGTRCLFHSRY